MLLVIHQIFSLMHDWSKRVTWPNIPQLKLGNIRKYSPILKIVILIHLPKRATCAAYTLAKHIILLASGKWVSVSVEHWTDDKLCNCRFNLTAIFITTCIMFRSTQLVCCTHQIKLPNGNLLLFIILVWDTHVIIGNMIPTIHPRECFYKIPESWKL